MIIDGQNHWDDLLEPDNSNTNTNLEGDANPDNQNDPTPEPIPNDTNSDPEPKDKDLDVFSEFLKGRGLRDGKTLIYQDEEGNEQEVDFNTLDTKKYHSMVKLKENEENYILTDLLEIHFLEMKKLDEKINYKKTFLAKCVGKKTHCVVNNAEVLSAVDSFFLTKLIFIVDLIKNS